MASKHARVRREERLMRDRAREQEKIRVETDLGLVGDVELFSSLVSEDHEVAHMLRALAQNGRLICQRF